MKFFRKKTARTDKPRPQTAGTNPAQNFYPQNAGEAPLDEHFGGTAAHQTRRTSRHSPGMRRETSNRASNQAIILLLVRAVLIVFLLVAGFAVLRLVLGHMTKPSEKEKERWEANEIRMEKQSAPDVASAGSSVPQKLIVGSALIGQRLEQWEQTERHLRSAEALTRRGIDEEAIQRLGQALRIMPDNREAQKLLVDTYMRRGLYAEAVPLCIRLLDQDSRQQDLQMTLLRALQESGQIDAGLVLADHILLDQPNNRTVLSIAAAGQVVSGNKNAALALFERILENDAKNTNALENCGKIYFEQGAYEKAVPYYLELARLDMKPVYYQALARCYAQQNQAGKAVVFLGQAASLFGIAEISPWLRDPIFDPVRETVEFRSFADRVVGVETRKAIEDINRRESEKTAAKEPGGTEPVKRPDSELISPKK